MKNHSISSLEHSTKQQGMHPTLKLIMWIGVFLLFFTVENVYSQVDTLDCVEDADTCSSTWTTGNYLGNMGSGITGHIYYRKRVCNGVEHIMIDSAIALDNGRFLDSVNRYNFKYTAFNELADVYLLQHLYRNSTSISANPNLPSTIVQLYKASCGVWLSCTYNVNPASRQCDTGYTEPYPITSELTPLSIYKFHPCGTVCCKKTYAIYRDEVPDSLEDPFAVYHPVIIIKNLSITRSHFRPKCTLEDTFPEPCQDGC